MIPLQVDPGEAKEAEVDCDAFSSLLSTRVPYENFQQLEGLLLGSSSAMKSVGDQIMRVAPTQASVLITGESGTGKEMVAHAIYCLSARKDRPFITVNCGAISPQLIESEIFGHEKGSFTGAIRDHRGYFERADGGTLFLDEITEMPADLQVKLLRVLETGRFMRVGGARELSVDIRIIAATNRDPHQAVEEGMFREDLFYRIQVFLINLPPLRERSNDIEMLSQYFLDGHNRKEGTSKYFSARAQAALSGYYWPGNLRELRNVVYRAYIMADRIIDIQDLPAEITYSKPRPKGPSVHIQVGCTIADVEKRVILATLEHCKGRRERAAHMLGVSVKTLYNRLREYRESSRHGADGSYSTDHRSDGW